MSDLFDMTLPKCPKCEKYCDTHIIYVNGNPLSYHTCSCGYSDKNETFTYSSRTFNNANDVQITGIISN